MTSTSHRRPALNAQRWSMLALLIRWRPQTASLDRYGSHGVRSALQGCLRCLRAQPWTNSWRSIDGTCIPPADFPLTSLIRSTQRLSSVPRPSSLWTYEESQISKVRCSKPAGKSNRGQCGPTGGSLMNSRTPVRCALSGRRSATTRSPSSSPATGSYAQTDR